MHLTDHEEIILAARLLVAPGGVVELRALDARLAGERRGGTVSGYFNSHTALADAVAGIVAAKGIYLTLNPIDPTLLARRVNRLAPAGRGELTADADIISRRWLPIDLDAVRPAGVSSSDTEHDAALERTLAIRDALTAEGWPDPVLGDSGNGGHALYRVNLAADDRGLVSRLLKSLAARFDDDRVKLDPAVHNPSRIWKLYGTRACKGDHTPERPHRMARLLEVPDTVQVVPAELLEAIAGRGRPALSLATFKGRTTPYGRAALERESAEVARAVVNSRNNTLNRAAFSLGQLIGGGELDGGEAAAALCAAAAECGLPESEAEGTIRRALADGEAAPRTAPRAVPEPAGRTQPAIGGVVRPFSFFTEGVSGITTMSLAIRDGKPIAEPELLVSWADGRRERLAATSRLEGPGGTVYLDPMPRTAEARCIVAGWRAEAQDRWIAGYTPDPAEILSNLEHFIASRVWLTEVTRPGSLSTLALWTVLTYIAPIFSAVPYLHATGPKGSGKTVLMQALGDIVFMPFPSSNASGAALFRQLHARGGTLLLDEAESLHDRGERASDLRSILLSGYRQGSPVVRCVGDDHRVASFDVFGPKMLASIGTLPDALASRCIRTPMLRKPAGTRLPARALAPADLRDDLHALALSFSLDLLKLRGECAGLDNRNADLWGPILALAGWFEAAGLAGLTDRVRDFAERAIDCASDTEADDQDAAILGALLTRLSIGQDVTAKDLLQELRAGDDADAWDAWTPARTAARLRRYDLRARKAGSRRTYQDIRPGRVRAVMESYGMIEADATRSSRVSAVSQDRPYDTDTVDTGGPGGDGWDSLDALNGSASLNGQGEPEPGRCRSCGHSRWWRLVGGEGLLTCGVCHPPTGPEARGEAVEWVDGRGTNCRGEDQESVAPIQPG